MRKAAAVVIGVNKTGGFDELESAANGAKDVASWLEKEGFAVECLTDIDGVPVTSQAVSKAIGKFATSPAKYDFLLVYFSGHGQWHTRSDHWLLSGAPESTTEAVNLEGAMYVAKRCGIPNIVFVSDACRTIPKSAADNLVNGIDAFPNHAGPMTAKIDFFKATSEARPAYEIPIKGTVQSALTWAIRSAFTDPEPKTVKQLSDEGETISVVPNRLLETVLQERVDKLLNGIDGRPTQRLETSVPSEDHIYIAKVEKDGPPPATTAGPTGPPPSSKPTTRGVRKPGLLGRLSKMFKALLPTSVKSESLTRPLTSSAGREAAKEISERLRGNITTPNFLSDIERDEAGALIPAAGIRDRFETQTGFIISGARVAEAVVASLTDGGVEILSEKLVEGSQALRVYPSRPAHSVAVRLKDGRCVVLAALQGYLGYAVFDKNGLKNVNYVPSSNNQQLWDTYNKHRAEIDRLRALVAVAVEHNTFRIRSVDEGYKLADRVRVEKALDPTLGLYACYAYAQAGMEAQIRDVRGFMRQDLQQVDLFDVQMLSNDLNGPDPLILRAPFCPMLTQGWNFLRPSNIELPSVLMKASASLSDSLWSTFKGKGARAVFETVKSGELK